MTFTIDLQSFAIGLLVGGASALGLFTLYAVRSYSKQKG